MKHDVAHHLPHDLYVAAGARAASIFGNVVAVTAMLLDFHDRGAGAWAVAGVLAAGALPIVVLAPLVGSVVDRLDSRVLIVTSSLWQAAACLLLAFVSQPQVVLALVALNACGTAVTNPLFLALTSAMVPSGQLAAANSVQQGGVIIAMMAAPPASGLLIGITGGVRTTLLLDAVVFVVIAVAGLLISTRRQPGAEEPRPSARDGITMLFNDRALAASVALAVLLPLAVQPTYVAQVFLVRDTFGASTLTFGMVQATHMVGLLIGTVLVSRLNTVRRIMFGSPLSAAVMALAIGLIGVLNSLPATFALYVLAGICMSMVSVSTGTLLLLRTPESAVGRVTASFTAIHRSTGLIAYGLGGVIAGLLPPDVVYLLSGAVSLVIVLSLAPAFRQARGCPQNHRTTLPVHSTHQTRRSMPRQAGGAAAG
jgi:MFS family permease